ncbi:MAG: hydrogenase expression/formation protein HypE [Nanoarchaeota archaeon]
MVKNRISIEQGSGGEEMSKLIKEFSSNFYRGNWKYFDDDGAIFSDNCFEKKICFTTDSYVVDPIEFRGGNIGDLAICGTINDLLVMGADPIGISLSFIIEEGLSREVFDRIVKTIESLSLKLKIPIVTGDTKVVEKGGVDKIIINTSGVGLVDRVIDSELEVGDKIIVSGGIGEHGIALLSDRFDFETSINTDSKALIDEMRDVKSLIKFAKDSTRGGIAGVLNEIANKKEVNLEIVNKDIPIKNEVKSACKLFGFDPLSIACEGRVVLICSKKNSEDVLLKLKKYNKDASIIGEVIEKNKDLSSGLVLLETQYGKRIVEVPKGKIVPRIC